MKKLSFVSLLLVLSLGASFSFAHASKGSGSSGSGSSGRDHVENSIHSSDDGTPDQGRGDFDAFGNPVDDSFGGSSDDDGTPDQGRGDFDAAGNPIDDSFSSGDDDGAPDQGKGDFGSKSSDDEIVKAMRAWFARVFSWWF